MAQLETRREMVHEVFRLKVLTALDAATWECFGPKITQNTCGATDADLPRLFKAIDGQADAVAERFGIELTDTA